MNNLLEKSTNTMKKYEYKTLNNPKLKEINELGKDGWRVISTTVHDAFGAPSMEVFMERELTP